MHAQLSNNPMMSKGRIYGNNCKTSLATINGVQAIYSEGAANIARQAMKHRSNKQDKQDKTYAEGGNVARQTRQTRHTDSLALSKGKRLGV